jgi:hypothetical protein
MSFVLTIVILYTLSTLFVCFSYPIYQSRQVSLLTICNNKCASLLKDHVSYDIIVLTSYKVNAPKIALGSLCFKLYMHIISRVQRVQVSYTKIAYSTYGFVHIKSRLLQLYGTNVLPPLQPCHVIADSPLSANENATGGGIGSKQQQHAGVLTGGKYIVRTLTLVATCIQNAYSCIIWEVLYSSRVKTNIYTLTLCFREVVLKINEARLNIPYNYCRFKSILDILLPAVQKVLDYYFANTSFEICLYFQPPIPTLQLSEIISVTNRFEKMSDFPSPGKEISHGKFCQPLCINLISASVPFFDFRLSRNLYKTCSYIPYMSRTLYKTCSYILYMPYEPIPTKQPAWFKYSIIPYSMYPNASILTDQPRLCAFSSLNIPTAYTCTFYSCNGSNRYGE